jgi:hypothetical protein
MKYAFSFSFLFALLCCHAPSSKKEINHQIAEANGVANFEKVEMLEFIFNSQRDTASPSSRHWQWYPDNNEVVFVTDSNTTKFTRYDTSTQELKKLNARFTNDEYWLLFSFHMSWDSGFELVDSSNITAPISGKSLRKLTVKYNNTDGFTPGDMYGVYIDGNQQIQEWVFHKKGAPEPSMITTWEKYKDFSGLKIAQEHKSKDGKFRIWFTDIQIKTKDSP